MRDGDMEVWVGCELLVVFYGESSMNEWRPPFNPRTLLYIPSGQDVKPHKERSNHIFVHAFHQVPPKFEGD